MPFPKIKLSDDSGNAVSVTDNRLNVNAYLSATPTIDIGDVSLLLDGTAADYGTGNVNTSGRTLRVTLASDDYHFGEKGTAADHDGTIHGQLRYIGDQVKNAYDELVAIDADTNVLLLTAHTEDSAHSNADIGTMSLAVRNDTLASLVSDDGDYAPFQVNANGALYITGGEVENAAVQSEPLLIGGRYDSSARTLDDGDAGAVALNASGHVIMDVVDGGQLDTIIDTLETTLTAIETDQAAIEVLLTGIDADTNTIQGNIVNIGNATYSDDADWTDGSSKHLLVGGLYQSSMQSVTDGDVAPFQVDANGVLKVSPSTGSEFQVDIVSSAALTVDLGSNNDVTVTSGSVGHDITGLASDDNDTVGTSAEKISGADGDVACKRVDIMAHPDNTGYIWVGDSAVSVDGLNGGIRLSPGDFYSMDIDNTGDIYVIATVDTENVCFNYFT